MTFPDEGIKKVPSSNLYEQTDSTFYFVYRLVFVDISLFFFQKKDQYRSQTDQKAIFKDNIWDIMSEMDDNKN